MASAANSKITRAVEAEIDRFRELPIGLVQISTMIFDGLAFCIAPGMLSRKAREAGDGRGLELWRLIHREYNSRSGPVMEAKRKAFLEPVRCRDEPAVRDRLTEWLCEVRPTVLPSRRSTRSGLWCVSCPAK